MRAADFAWTEPVQFRGFRIPLPPSAADAHDVAREMPDPHSGTCYSRFLRRDTTLQYTYFMGHGAAAVLDKPRSPGNESGERIKRPGEERTHGQAPCLAGACLIGEAGLQVPASEAQFSGIAGKISGTTDHQEGKRSCLHTPAAPAGTRIPADSYMRCGHCATGTSGSISPARAYP